MIGRRACTPRKLVLFSVLAGSTLALIFFKRGDPSSDGGRHFLRQSPDAARKQSEETAPSTTRRVHAALSSFNDGHPLWNGDHEGHGRPSFRRPADVASNASEADTKRMNLKSMGIEMRVDPLNVKLQVYPSMNEKEAEEAFHSFASELHLECRRHLRLGNTTDGGWDICVAGPFTPANGSCLVYSFGIGDNWSFDDDISRRFGCTVRSFDPSIEAPDHQRSSRIHFYKIGIGSSNNASSAKGWKLMTLDGIISMCQDDGKTIDYLKIDVESNEWEALEEMLSSGTVLSRVKQLAIEIHTKELDRIQSTVADLHRYWTILRGLELVGFRRWYWHFNLWGFFPSRTLEKYLSCCYEMVYINVLHLTELSSNTASVS